MDDMMQGEGGGGDGRRLQEGEGGGGGGDAGEEACENQECWELPPMISFQYPDEQTALLYALLPSSPQ